MERKRKLLYYIGVILEHKIEHQMEKTMEYEMESVVLAHRELMDGSCLEAWRVAR